MKALSTAFFALILSTSFAVADGCGIVKTLLCNVKQAKLGMTSWVYAWTQAHKSILIGKAEESILYYNKKMLSAFSMLILRESIYVLVCNSIKRTTGNMVIKDNCNSIHNATTQV